LCRLRTAPPYWREIHLFWRYPNSLPTQCKISWGKHICAKNEFGLFSRFCTVPSVTEIWWFIVARVHSRSLEIAPFDRAHMSFLLAFHSNYVAVLYRFWDIARYCQKSTIVTYPTCICALLGLTLLEFCQYFWRHETRVPLLSYGVICMILRFAFCDTIPACYGRTDGWTDGLTDTRRQHTLR